MEVYEIIVHK